MSIIGERSPSSERTCPRCTSRPGYTLAEMLVVLLIVSVLLGLAISRLASAADQTAVRAAAGDAAALISSARSTAIYRRAPVAVTIDTVTGAIALRTDSGVLLRRDLRVTYGVRLGVSRESTAFDARGLGLGAANLSIVVRRRGAVDTVFLSRLGRVRY